VAQPGGDSSSFTSSVLINLLDIAMRRIVTCGALLLLSGAIAAQSRTESLVFVFRGLDPQQDLAILHPLIAPDIGVQLDAGPRNLEGGAMLNCKASVRTRSAIIESKIGQLSEMVLDCGEHKFVIKALDFDPRPK
jgi:hypothetical protein